jgi:microcystin-dependent protein
MSDQFVAEIRIFGFNFPPTGWAFCDGQILPLSQNTALFSLLGTTYGGDGKSTFALPDLQGRTPLMWGQGAGLSLYDLGQEAGEESVTLIQSEMPFHNHTVGAVGADPGDLQAPSNVRALARSGNGFAYVSGPLNAQFAPEVLPIAGNSFPHNNMMPYLTLNFCIALQGIFPAHP